MLNSYGFGGYLEWSSGGRHKVFIDGRGELYEMSGVFADYMHISLLKPGALSVLGGYRVQACLLDATNLWRFFWRRCRSGKRCTGMR